MKPLFVDASVMLAAADSEDRHHAAAQLLLSGPTSLATLDLAFYEVSNVAMRAWRDLEAARRLRVIVDAIAEDGGLIRVDEALAAEATAIAEREVISAYDAAYVAGAASVGATLVSCDLGDLVGRDLAVTPEQANQLH